MKPKSVRKKEARNARKWSSGSKTISHPFCCPYGVQPCESESACPQSFVERDQFGLGLNSNQSDSSENSTPRKIGDCRRHPLSHSHHNTPPFPYSSTYPVQVSPYAFQSPITCTPFCAGVYYRPDHDETATLESVNRKLDCLLLDSANSSSTESPHPSTSASKLKRSPMSLPSNAVEETSAQHTPVNKQLPLPPLGVFWDIENCSVPKGKSALTVVQRLRERFLSGYTEAEFLCVCDIRKESPHIIQELNDAQVSVVHVSGNSKNAADDKLRQAMRRYADVYTSLGSGVFSQDRSPSILLISGDVNFSPTISDLRYRKRLYVILLHNAHAPDALLVCANEHYNFHTVLDDLPERNVHPRRPFIEDRADIPLKGGHCSMDVVVTDLPYLKNLAKLKNRLKKLSDNCGGKVVTIQGQFAVLRFPNKEAALRASKRMNGEDVYGSKIKVIYSSQMEFRTQSLSQLEARSSEKQTPIAVDAVRSNRFEGHSSVPNVSIAEPAPTSSSRICASFPVNSVGKPSASDSEVGPRQQAPMLAQQSHSSTSQSETASSSYNSSRESSPTYAQFGVAAGGSLAQMAAQIAPDPSVLRREIASLLRGVPGFSLPLFKFREMFEKRYRRSILSMDIYKLTDLVIISGGYSRGTSSPGHGRTITLRPEWQDDEEEIIDIYCPAHPPQARGSSSSHLGWAEKEVGALLPNVIVELKEFSENLLSLIDSHGGNFPLLSFLDCYESAFPPLQKVLDPEGVPLEHIISCVHGVEICTGENGMKRAQLVAEPAAVAQPLDAQLMQLSKELIDLLKTFPRCSIPFSKLIPAYHHHFGKQCKVSDYGHSSLSSLLHTLPSTIQILGDTNNRVITLSHKAQMKRFATDVLRVLKAVNGTTKQVEMDEFPNAYKQLLSKSFAPEDYGLCSLVDLVTELVRNSSLVTLSENEAGKWCLSMPRRIQTSAELQKMRTFELEVVEMLRHSVRCEMPFSKFIPSYHHHFGAQCRVSSFGFSKLIELLEAIPDTVEIVEAGKEKGCVERLVRLTAKEQLKVIGQQIWGMVHKRDEAGVQTQVYELEELFTNEHGYSLRPELCGARNIRDLCDKLPQFLQLDGDKIKLSDKSQVGNIGPIIEENSSSISGVRYYHAPRSYGYKNKNRSPLKASAGISGSPGSFSHFTNWDNASRLTHIAPPPLTILSPSLSSPAFSVGTEDMNVFTFDGQPPMSPPYFETFARETNSPCLSPQLVWTYPFPYYPPPTPPAPTPSVVMPTFSFNGPWSNAAAPTMLSAGCFEPFPQN